MNTVALHIPSASRRCLHRARTARGFSLIELMVAMVLGLIVIAGAGSVFLASSRTYRTNDALSEVQTNSRIAFELLARDIRDAGLTGCNNNGRVANVLNDQATDWYANWANALHGYDAGQSDPANAGITGNGQRVAGTDSLEILSAGASGLSVAMHNATSAQFKLNEKSSDLASGDLIVVCDPDHTALVQITNYNSSNVTLVHDTGNGVATPGNCSKGLGYPTVCTTNGNTYTFPPNSQIAKLTAADWYIGKNPSGGDSLYRVDVSTNAGVPQPAAQEMVRNVTGMTIFYHQPSLQGFIKASAVTNWSTVDAVRVTLQLDSTDQRAGTGYTPITRSFTATTTVRNRVH